MIASTSSDRSINVFEGSSQGGESQLTTGSSGRLTAAAEPDCYAEICSGLIALAKGIIALGLGEFFNPAVAVGITIMGMIDMSFNRAFFVATLLGGAVAALAFNVLKLSED